MARVCEMCGKGFLKGNLVCFSNKKSIKRSYPNLRSVRVSVHGVSGRLKICSSCLSRIKVVKKEASDSQALKAKEAF